jgi:DMSO/TMAO reductase YedYZ molybdopterin-dependent catalytic subunit/thiosulfate reductase cytochrome b subunit
MNETIVPTLIIIVHLINLFCLTLLIRSGIQILFDHPKLYWTDHTTDDNHWLRFGKKVMPKDKLWTSLDEAEDPGKIGIPSGSHNLGSARSWHFTTAIIWVVTGAVYVSYLFTSGEWRRLIPTDFGVFSRAIDAMVSYLSFNTPVAQNIPGHYNALQQLTYGSVVFILTPIVILSGLALSPALIARFPGYLKLFGNRRQIARSVHFLGMVAFSLFILVHITMALVFHFYESIKNITLGRSDANFALALTLFLTAIILVIAFNIWVTFFTLGNQVRVRTVLTAFYTPVVRLLFGWMKSNQHYTKKDISPFFRVNGYPPTTAEYEQLKASDFKDWKLRVYGLVERPLEMSLAQIKAMKKQDQITKHNCIQGWTAVAEWGGLPMYDVLELCKPLPNAKYVLFHCYDEDEQGRAYYAGLRTEDMYDAQTILAYEMNDKPLPIEHGAPLRLRCEKKYGYKMAKYIHSIEFVESFAHIGEGRGGYREDTVFFDWEAAI